MELKQSIEKILVDNLGVNSPKTYNIREYLVNNFDDLSSTDVEFLNEYYNCILRLAEQLFDLIGDKRFKEKDFFKVMEFTFEIENQELLDKLRNHGWSATR